MFATSSWFNIKSLVLFSLSDCLFSLTENQPFLSATTKIRSSSTRFLIPSVHHLISESSGDLKVKNILPEAFKAASKQSYDNYLQDAPPVVVELLEGATFEGGKSGQLPLAPTLSVGKPLREGCVCITVPIDTLSLVHWDSYLCDLSISLKEGICQQLQTIRDEILWKVFAPYFFHFVCVSSYAICCCYILLVLLSRVFYTV